MHEKRYDCDILIENQIFWINSSFCSLSLGTRETNLMAQQYSHAAEWRASTAQQGQRGHGGV